MGKYANVLIYRRLLLIFVLFYSYAFIRYHIGNDVSYAEWLFVLNKAFAWFSFTLIGLAILPKSWFKTTSFKRKPIGITGFIFADAHILLNLFLISYKRYPVLYHDEANFSFLGLSIITLGIFSFCCFLLAFFSSIKRLPEYFLKFGLIGFVGILFHPLFLGAQKWFQPAKWPLYLPPITLLAFLTGILLLIYRVKLKKN